MIIFALQFWGCLLYPRYRAQKLPYRISFYHHKKSTNVFSPLHFTEEDTEAQRSKIPSESHEQRVGLEPESVFSTCVFNPTQTCFPHHINVSDKVLL